MTAIDRSGYIARDTAGSVRPVPCDAERIQTACRRVHEGTLSVDGCGPAAVAMVHLFESEAFMVVPDDASVREPAGQELDGIPAMLELADCAPISLRERVRSLIWLSGRVHSVPAALERELAVEITGDHPDARLLDVGHGHCLLRLHVDNAVIASATGAASVDAHTLSGAEPDPFWEYEGQWLSHLEADHRDLVDRLTLLFPDHLRDGRVRPLGLDRFGITFRVETPTADNDVRLSFDRPCTGVGDLSAALHDLVAHA
ncbi:hypothetical protein GOHSU_29_00400 [Gordonia hirsuta DSM 44140 = NBRC 16056]|uniref:DUF2470 domain-containing protein n=1 Tax=Gordonia hirsuta DSM 44140 = NBRC 16056 TaxID=1121927 RepID=L7LDC4_9ACTN|nr:DUF2470 domain-containing protein [Gordonia hirsuta]GAC58057.1 hypothetical protein GOHSU_29_00400 [Gordonia hirsuta DSM 44140 = NBRC 16056]